MNKFNLIEKAIKKIPRGKIFFSESFYAKYSVKVIRRVLLRLTKKNEIGTTICRGMYFIPEESRFFSGCAIPPSTEDLVYF